MPPVRSLHLRLGLVRCGYISMSVCTAWRPSTLIKLGIPELAQSTQLQPCHCQPQHTIIFALIHC